MVEESLLCRAGCLTISWLFLARSNSTYPLSDTSDLVLCHPWLDLHKGQNYPRLRSTGKPPRGSNSTYWKPFVLTIASSHASFIFLRNLRHHCTVWGSVISLVHIQPAPRSHAQSNRRAPPFPPCYSVTVQGWFWFFSFSLVHKFSLLGPWIWKCWLLAQKKRQEEIKLNKAEGEEQKKSLCIESC